MIKRVHWAKKKKKHTDLNDQLFALQIFLKQLNGENKNCLTRSNNAKQLVTLHDHRTEAEYSPFLVNDINKAPPYKRLSGVKFTPYPKRKSCIRCISKDVGKNSLVLPVQMLIARTNHATYPGSNHLNSLRISLVRSDIIAFSFFRRTVTSWEKKYSRQDFPRSLQS